MNDVCFKASLQNTLNPEVGTFDNVGNKEGTFTLEDGEYYLTNNTSTSYRVYYPTKNIIYSAGLTTVEFDINYPGSSNFEWCLLFNGDDGAWHGIGTWGTDLEFRGQTLPNYHLITSPNTWLHVKCIFDYDHGQNYVDIYIDNVKVNNFTISKYYGIKYIDLLGNSGGFVSKAKIKNIIIYDNSKKHYLDTDGLTSLWSKIKSLFATKSELASKANTSDLSTVATSGSYNDLLDKPTPFDVDVLKSWPDGAEAHNAMWGGRNITAAFDAGTVSANIANGTFRDIFPGDYIRKQVTIPRVLADDGTTVLYRGDTYAVDWVIADCDYWGNTGLHVGRAHHVVIVPRVHIFNARMNPTNTTEGGYAGSEMFKKIIPACATGIVNAFGSDHILDFQDAITNSVDTSHASSGTPQWTGTPGWFGEWVSVQCNLMSEKMVYGAPIFSAGAMNNVMAIRQMSAFRLSSSLMNNDIWGRAWWLRDVVSSSHFAAVYGYPYIGLHATAFGASDQDREMSDYPGVRPFALLR